MMSSLNPHSCSSSRCVDHVETCFVFFFAFPDSLPPSNNVTNQTAPYGSYGYPSMQPGYRQAAASHADPSSCHELYGQSAYNQFSQVRNRVLFNLL